MATLLDELEDAPEYLRDGGENIVFRGNSISVVPINRIPGKRDRERVNFEEDTDSIVELPGTLDEPTAGETLKDQFGRYHRIKYCTFNGHSWVCGCRVSAEP